MFCIGLVHAILIGTIRQHTSFPFLDELWVRAYPYIGKHFILFDVLVVLVFTSMAIAPFVWCVKNELGFSDIFVFLIPVSIVHAFMVATEWPNFDMVLISVFGSIVIGLLIKYPIVRLPKKIQISGGNLTGWMEKTSHVLLLVFFPIFICTLYGHWTNHKFLSPALILLVLVLIPNFIARKTGSRSLILMSFMVALFNVYIWFGSSGRILTEV